MEKTKGRGGREKKGFEYLGVLPYNGTCRSICSVSSEANMAIMPYRS